MNFALDEVHASWHDFFRHRTAEINLVLEKLSPDEISPSRENVFRAFQQPLEEVRVVIFGQDPYPGIDVADGLAFSSQEGNPIPASLRNIFIEYESDLALKSPSSPDLSAWSNSGVLLLNRSLTTSLGNRNAHGDVGWKNITDAVAEYLGRREIVAILWGNNARELHRFFSLVIESSHPSPLSARRGFFGSRPFSQANQLLVNNGRKPINWSL